MAHRSDSNSVVGTIRTCEAGQRCPFTGIDRKSPWSGQTDAFDPQRTRAAPRASSPDSDFHAHQTLTSGGYRLCFSGAVAVIATSKISLVHPTLVAPAG
jgi:hypothetical protein